MTEKIKPKHLPSVSKTKWQWGLAIGLVLLLYTFIFMPNIRQKIFGEYFEPSKENVMRLNDFSPDNRLLSFDFCHGSNCFAGLLNLQSGEMTKIVPPDPNERWSSGRFSPTGKYLALGR